MRNQIRLGAQLLKNYGTESSGIRQDRLEIVLTYDAAPVSREDLDRLEAWGWTQRGAKAFSWAF